MAISPFMASINQICDEKGLSKDIVLETLEAAIAAAYRKDYGKPSQIIKVKLDPESGQTKVWRVFEVVEEVEDPESQKTLKDAKKDNPKIKIGEHLEYPLEAKSDFGRIAAQTAKQVIIQRIREAERDMLYKEFKEKEKQIINGLIQQIEGANVIVDLGKLNGLMLPSDQISNEKYYSGQRLKIYLRSVEESSRGPRVLVSRTDPGLILGLFELEVPEIAAKTVEIKNIAREAGSRSKVAVFTSQQGLDPVGSCVGQRGTRIQAILAEIGEEKIDIILWHEKDEQFISNALSPAKVNKVILAKKDRKAIVQVNEDQLSLAIGKGGQNVRLASKLTSWSIDVEKTVEKEEEKSPKVKNKLEDKTVNVTEVNTTININKPDEKENQKGIEKLPSSSKKASKTLKTKKIIKK
ncbi:MAG: transcription termination factor NusA [Patescibacteria group bacterium]